MNVLKAIQNQGHGIHPLSSRVCGKLDLYKKPLPFCIDILRQLSRDKNNVTFSNFQAMREYRVN